MKCDTHKQYKEQKWEKKLSPSKNMGRKRVPLPKCEGITITEDASMNK